MIVKGDFLESFIINQDSEIMCVVSFFDYVGEYLDPGRIAFGRKHEVLGNFKLYKDKLSHHTPAFREAIKQGKYMEFLHSIREEIVCLKPSTIYAVMNKMHTYIHEHPVYKDVESKKECDHYVCTKAGKTTSNWDLIIYQCKDCDFHLCTTCLNWTFT